MISRISAEFEGPELAEAAIRRVKQSVNGVYSAKIIYDKNLNNTLKLSHGTICTLIPTYTNNFTNFLTAVTEYPSSEDVVPEISRRTSSKIYIICENDSTKNISAILNAMGGLKIRLHE